MAAVSGQLLENLTKKTLTKIRTNLTIFMLTLPTSREGLVGKPMLPRKRRTLDRLEVGAGMVHQAISKLPKITFRKGLL